ncbi:unnamed protein product [Polarella glacialis]|uniref:Uncharacterized protein n=1 Tax=Polarella glacialis TaxID=89957 RepID=A0A813LG90_POLGL|nr:unnamed protein product [Polarella glacialis]
MLDGTATLLMACAKDANHGGMSAAMRQLTKIKSKALKVNRKAAKLGGRPCEKMDSVDSEKESMHDDLDASTAEPLEGSAGTQSITLRREWLVDIGNDPLAEVEAGEEACEEEEGSRRPANVGQSQIRAARTGSITYLKDEPRLVWVQMRGFAKQLRKTFTKTGRKVQDFSADVVPS